MRMLDTFKDRAEWLSARRHGLGSSDIAGIVGVSPYTTPWQVYVDKVGAVALDDTENEAMRWGRLLEDLVLDEWERQSGLHAAFRGRMVRHDAHDWAIATPDALAVESQAPEDPSEAVAVVEAKTSSDFSWDEIPLHYQAQAQWQMAVTGLDVTLFPVLHNGRAFRIYELKADYDDQAALIQAGERFWRAHVLAESPPPVEAGDNQALALVFSNDDGSEVDVDPDVVDRLVRLRANERQMTKERDLLEARLKDQLHEASVGLVDGRKAISWKTQTAHRVDTRRLRAEMPEVADQFTNEIESRVFRLHMKGDD